MFLRSVRSATIYILVMLAVLILALSVAGLL